MSAKKTCAACGKQIPDVAVVCVFCSAKQPTADPELAEPEAGAAAAATEPVLSKHATDSDAPRHQGLRRAGGARRQGRQAVDGGGAHQWHVGGARGAAGDGERGDGERDGGERSDGGGDGGHPRADGRGAAADARAPARAARLRLRAVGRPRPPHHGRRRRRARGALLLPVARGLVVAAPRDAVGRRVRAPALLPDRRHRAGRVRAVAVAVRLPRRRRCGRGGDAGAARRRRRHRGLARRRRGAGDPRTAGDASVALAGAVVAAGAPARGRGGGGGGAALRRCRSRRWCRSRSSSR